MMQQCVNNFQVNEIVAGNGKFLVQIRPQLTSKGLYSYSFQGGSSIYNASGSKRLKIRCFIDRNKNFFQEKFFASGQLSVVSRQKVANS